MKRKRGTLALEDTSSKGGSVKRRKDSRKLYVDFYYYGQRVTKSTDLNDTPANDRKVRAFLDRIMERIEDGTFKFADAFPGASTEEKAYFTQLEGRDYRPEPHQVLFGEYVQEWLETIFPSFGSPTKRKDYREAIETRILPSFLNSTFYQITGTTLFKFTQGLTWKKGIKKGSPCLRRGNQTS